MQSIFIVTAFVVLLSALAGMVRVSRGPSAADRMLAPLLLGTAGVATQLLMATALDAPALKDVALVFVALATITSIVFVRLGWAREEASPTEDEA